jgi:hypothetical protein
MPKLILTREKDFMVNRWTSCRTLLNGWDMVMMDPGDREVIEIPAGKHYLITVIEQAESPGKHFVILDDEVKRFHIYAMVYPNIIVGFSAFLCFLLAFREIFVAQSFQGFWSFLPVLGMVYYFMSSGNLLLIREMPVLEGENLKVTEFPKLQ